MAGNGPARNPNARRRNARPAMRRLPAVGRRGDPPAFPLAKPTVPERALWAELWATPQAVAWEELGWTRVVARYVRVAIMAENPKRITPTLAGKAMTEARLLEDGLGLSPKGMASLGWEIATEGEPQEAGGDADVVDLAAFRDRVSV